MHKNQPLPDQNVVTNENRFKSKLIEKPCSENCYTLVHRTPEDALNDSVNTRNKRVLDNNDEDPAAKRTVTSPTRSETRLSMNNSFTETKNTRSASKLNSQESSPATTSKTTHLEDGWSFSEETLYRALKKIYEYNSCALARFIRTKTCAEIREHIKKVIIS